MARSRCWIALASLVAVSRLAVADPVMLDKPLYAEVFVKNAAPRNAKVSGNLLSYDETNLTLKAGKDEKSYAWADLTPASAFTLRQRLIDKTKAADWVVLGRFGWSVGAKDQARAALKTAVTMDAGLKAKADEILAQPAGEPRAGEAEKSAGEPAAEKPEKADSPELVQSGDAPVPQPGRKKGEAAERVKYAAATPEQHAAALKEAREEKAGVEGAIGVTLTEIETDHFIIFTDWNPREHNFLKKNLEDAYRVVSKQFDMSPKDNIFIGKLPVYMWADYSEFKKFGSQIDGFPVTKSIAGYYRGNSTGIGHMSMWKPNADMTGTTSIKDAEKLWGYVLIHEFSHAFVARYRTNEHIPRWLNEGMAEVIASSQIPYPERRRYAREIALDKRDLTFLFEDENMPTGVYYPVMQSLVEMLVSSDRKTFIKLIDAIKDGTDPEDALKQLYKTDYKAFVRTWREWVVKQR